MLGSRAANIHLIEGLKNSSYMRRLGSYWEIKSMNTVSFKGRIHWNKQDI